MKNFNCKYLIIGSGLGGLFLALRLSRYGDVIVATKKKASESNTQYAQGGIAVAVAPGDSYEKHVADTLSVGGGLCHEEIVEKIISRGPECIDDLEKMGLVFEHRGGLADTYDLGKEGGHSKRRVLHVGDSTGKAIVDILLEKARENPRIRILEGFTAIDLVTTGWLGMSNENRCMGAYFLDESSSQVVAVKAPFTTLATGGAGKVYLYTSNPDVATGDGIAMAWRAGLPVVNMEFVQFHPTCLYHSAAKSFLISEAVRGEGGRLINSEGVSFTEEHDARGSLAPRDIVARAIDWEMKTSGRPCVYLDITHRSADFLEKRFPTIYRTCMHYGLDITRDPIPVVPAAHYFCGGVRASLNGMTDLSGLYAIGETACTGLHGANRLASNSLLEALVCAKNTAETMGAAVVPEGYETVAIPSWRLNDAVPSDEAVVVEHNWNEVRTCMWDYVGIVRTDKRLDRALRRINNLRKEIRQYYLDYLVTADVLELRNIATVAELVVRSAQQRKESRGLHYTLDYKKTSDDFVGDTVLCGRPGEAFRHG